MIALNKIEDAKSSGKKNELVDDAAFLLFDQAQIIEGRMPADLTAFSKRMTRIMSFSLKSDSGKK